jgi:flagellar biosynthesis/type III secretory pathway chaperone
MTDSIANLVSALRLELGQYGALLALLDRQQEQIAARSAGEVYQSIGAVKQQSCAVQQARGHRDECRARLAQALQQPREASFASLIELLPEDRRGLLRDLVRQNNDLLGRVRQRVRQNHLRLSRSIELIQGLLNSLSPSRISRVYDGRGAMTFRRFAPRSSYEAFC